LDKIYTGTLPTTIPTPLPFHKYIPNTKPT